MISPIPAAVFALTVEEHARAPGIPIPSSDGFEAIDFRDPLHGPNKIEAGIIRATDHAKLRILLQDVPQVPEAGLHIVILVRVDHSNFLFFWSFHGDPVSNGQSDQTGASHSGRTVMVGPHAIS